MECCLVFNAYEYDIQSCFPRILLDVLEYNFPQLKHFLHNKPVRSRILGYIFKAYPDLYKTVKSVTDIIIDDYISQLDKSNVLLRKIDGFVSKQKLINTSCSLLDIRLKYQYSILVMYNKMYVGLTVDDTVIIKGVSNKTVGLSEWWKDCLTNIDLTYLQSKIYDYWTSKDLSLFAIPTDDKFMFILKNKDAITVSDYKSIMISEIDIEWYYSNHILPFVRCILSEYLD